MMSQKPKIIGRLTAMRFMSASDLPEMDYLNQKLNDD
jgi:hypothetical protein